MVSTGGWDVSAGDLDRVEVALRAPRATICLVSGRTPLPAPAWDASAEENRIVTSAAGGRRPQV